VGGAYTASVAGAYSNVNKQTYLTGGTYEVTFTVVSVSAGSVGAGDIVVVGIYQSTPGTYTARVKVTSGTSVGIQAGGSGFSGVVSNISVREITGIHASQSTTPSKPILRRGAVNLALDGGDISGWSTTAAGVITPGQTDPIGGTSAQTFSGAGKNVYRPLVISAGVVTFAFTLYSPTAGTLSLGGASGPGVLDIVSVSAGWGTYAVTKTIPANDGCAMILNGTLTAITFHRAALFQGTYTAAQIQALGGIPLTTTAPASTALGPYFWQFDGVGDSLALSGPLFQMSDDHFTIAGYKSSAQQGHVFAPSTVASSRFGSVGAASTGATFLVEWYDGTNYVPLGVVVPVGSLAVGSAIKRGASLIARLDGVQVASGASFTALTTATGGSIGSGPLGQFSGAIYPAIAGKGTISDADALIFERFIATWQGRSI
jgi:hypothetical protein